MSDLTFTLDEILENDNISNEKVIKKAKIEYKYIDRGFFENQG